MPGLEGLKDRIEAGRKEREAKQAETVWDAYLRRKKEKAKMRKVRTERRVGRDHIASQETGCVH